VRAVAEFTEDPGGEDRAQAGLASVDLRVRVSTKMGAQTWPSWSIWALRASMMATWLVTMAA
jgi:hypothetical protein